MYFRATGYLRTALSDRSNVMDFGPTGTGTSDDTAAIQAAIDAAATAGGIVFFPGNIYRLSQSTKIVR